MRLLPAFVFFASVLPALADGPADNVPDKVRPVPGPGIAVPDTERKSLEEELAKLGEAIDAIAAKNDAKRTKFLPDVRIFHKAVHDALTYNEFFAPNEFAKAHALLSEGRKRADALLDRGEAPWTQETGLIVLGYVSKIDGSVQPYGLVVPDSWQSRSPFRHRLDIWFHGRGENLSEVNFLDGRMKQPGEFTPEDAFVLHPYGRYCNAFKFAGEVDVLEALEDVQKRYKIDEDRISERGFSMGGAAAWQFAVHYPDKWFAANPGAGFSETPRFLDVFQKEKLEPTSYEKTLWNLYDCDKWAINLSGCPTVAYSGELDTQKQAADVMEEALKKLDIPLTHIIGPKTKHQYEPGAKAEVERRMTSLAAVGRERTPREVKFQTYTLRYNQADWVTIDAVDEHWKPAGISAHWSPDDHKPWPSGMKTPSGKDFNYVTITAERVRAFTLHFPAGTAPTALPGFVSVKYLLLGSQADTAQLPSQSFLTIQLDTPYEYADSPQVASDRSWNASFHFDDGGHLKPGPLPESGLRKVHGLQGPIDDAFMDAFTFVRPTGTSKHEKVAAWVQAESARAVTRWRSQFRGEPPVKDDTAVTDADIADRNLVLWGDPDSNAILKKIVDKLPIRWDGDNVIVGDATYPAADHVPILIYPNPLNPKRYVVLNSGFTYRDYDDLNNARQVPKLPDWAIIDLRTPPNSRYPGKVVAADFFDESWTLKSGK